MPREHWPNAPPTRSHGTGCSGGTTSARTRPSLRPWSEPLGDPAVAAIAMLWVMAWLTSKTTVYTITDRRVVMRIGIVLSITLNLPFARIRSADASVKSGPSGDIALALSGNDQIAYVHLWPHARPWRVARSMASPGARSSSSSSCPVPRR